MQSNISPYRIFSPTCFSSVFFNRLEQYMALSVLLRSSSIVAPCVVGLGNVRNLARPGYRGPPACFMGPLIWLITGRPRLLNSHRFKHSVGEILKVICKHRIRIYTKEKAKVVAASWGTKLPEFLAALAILHQDKLKKRLNCTRTS